MSDVFIIGAGCSVPYGFPTGAMLMQNLKNFNYGRKFPRCDDESSDIFLVDLYQEQFGFSSTQNKVDYGKDYAWVLPYPEHKEFYNQLMDEIVLPFAQSIRHSMMVSTDEFLKNRLNQDKSDEADFGKRLIAREILLAENESEEQFFFEDGKRKQKKLWLGNIDWIQHLLSRIDQQSNWEEILKQTVFLTFNYDRVLEYCIFLYLTSDKQYTEANANAFIQGLHIYHVNGSIGSLEEIPFGDVENGKYKAIADRMETVWEKRKSLDQKEVEWYNDFLKNANRVFFLGFSYIPDNLKSIGIDRGAEIIHNAKVYATAMGLSPQNRLRISSYLNIKDYEKRFDIEPPEVKIERHTFDSSFIVNQKREKAEKQAKDWVKCQKKYYADRILKDASAMDLILDYYTFG